MRLQYVPRPLHVCLWQHKYIKNNEANQENHTHSSAWASWRRSGVAYPGVRDNRSTLNTKTGYDDDDDPLAMIRLPQSYLSSQSPGKYWSHSEDIVIFGHGINWPGDLNLWPLNGIMGHLCFQEGSRQASFLGHNKLKHYARSTTLSTTNGVVCHQYQHSTAAEK